MFLNRENTPTPARWVRHTIATVLFLVFVTPSLLLQHPAVDVNMYSSLGYTALHIAAYSARVDVVERLVEHPDIQIDLPSATPSGVRPLEVAHVEAREDVIRALLKAGAAPMAEKQPV